MKTKMYVYKDCISEADANIIINFINQNLELGFYSKNKKRYTIPLGTKPFDGTLERKDEMSKIKLRNFPDQVKDTLNRVMENAIKITEKTFSDSGLHPSNVFIAKQFAGGKIERHLDSADSFDQQLLYSTVLYLNEISDGDLCFPDLGFSYHPQAFEMIVFESKSQDSWHEVTEISSDRYSLPMFMSKDPNCYIE